MRAAGLGADDARWLSRLVAEWQLLADLSFADLVLWLPSAEGTELLALAQMRPTTGPTSYQEDVVGLCVAAQEHPHILRAWQSGVIVRAAAPDRPDRDAQRDAIPVRRQGRVLAVVHRESNLAAARSRSRLEAAYLRSGADLARMVAEGSFPGRSAPADQQSPRVGDGLIRLDAEGRVDYASPNALSAYRRLGLTGDLRGSHLASLTSELVTPTDPLEQPAERVPAGLFPPSGEVEGRGSVVALRAIRLVSSGRHIGALVLLQDVTELRRRDRQLLSKDATIREIHHRVKNNLQTVAALLRLQARRLDSPEARLALDESVRRVRSIAMVHETLSRTADESVDFDDVGYRILDMVMDVAAGGRPDERITVTRAGSFGMLPAPVATRLAMVLTELVQNAVEHAWGPAEAQAEPGTADGGGHSGMRREIVLEVRRSAERLRVSVQDTGCGLPPEFDDARSDGLGLQIVRTLVEADIGGRLVLSTRGGGGTEAVVEVPLDPVPAGNED